jgi:hypothetical protein
MVRFLIIFLLLTPKAFPANPHDPSDQNKELKETMINLAFIDGCMIATLSILPSFGIKESQVDIPALTEICYGLSRSRIKDYKI